MRTEEAVTQADGLEVGYVVLVSVYVALGVRGRLAAAAARAPAERGRRWLRSAPAS